MSSIFRTMPEFLPIQFLMTCFTCMKFLSLEQSRWILERKGWLIAIDWLRFNVPPNTLLVISGTGFTGQMTQPTVSKHWRKIGPDSWGLGFNPVRFTPPRSQYYDNYAVWNNNWASVHNTTQNSSDNLPSCSDVVYRRRRTFSKEIFLNISCEMCWIVLADNVIQTYKHYFELPFFNII